jgi:hypothetical protein
MSPETLQKGLYVNAAFTGIAGLALALLPVSLGALLLPGLPVWAVAALGVALALFALDVALIAAFKAGSPAFVGFVLVADVAWVAGVPLAVLLAPSVFTPFGVALALASSIAVAGFAVIEWKGMRLMAERAEIA